MSSKGKLDNSINAKRIMIASITGILITAAMLVISSALIESGKLKEESITAAVITINVLAGLACGICVKAKGRGGNGLNGLICGTVYAGILSLIAILSDIGTVDKADILRLFVISALFSYLGSKINLVKSNKKFPKKRKA